MNGVFVVVAVVVTVFKIVYVIAAALVMESRRKRNWTYNHLLLGIQDKGRQRQQ